MGIIGTVFVVLGVLAYLAIGLALAMRLSHDLYDGFQWWQAVLVVLLWPVLALMLVVAVIWQAAFGR